jgi:hypothetical protein
MTLYVQRLVTSSYEEKFERWESTINNYLHSFGQYDSWFENESDTFLAIACPPSGSGGAANDEERGAVDIFVRISFVSFFVCDCRDQRDVAKLK